MKTEFNKDIYWLVVVLYFIAVLVGFIVVYNSAGPFNIYSFIITFLIITGIFAAILMAIMSGWVSIEINQKELITKQHLTSKKEIYPLIDIVDFSSGTDAYSIQSRSGQHSGTSSTFCLKFKDGREVNCSSEEYANYTELITYVYNYCLRNNIIELKPLEERKRRR